MDTRPPPVDEVQEASEESFPASDPPSYTPTSASQPAAGAARECYEVPFERAVCRIELVDAASAVVPTVTAHLFVVDEDHQRVRPVVLPSGARAEARGRTASQALSDGIAILSRYFGAPTLYERRCLEEDAPLAPGEPLVVEG